MNNKEGGKFSIMSIGSFGIVIFAGNATIWGFEKSPKSLLMIIEKLIQ